MNAQTDWSRLLTGTIKAGQAVMITDEQLAESVKKEVAEMDCRNTVCANNNKYTLRLRRLTKGMTEADGIKLNFKVYKTTEYNAFACPDGSVRVFSALMDILNDEELLGVIGHIQRKPGEVLCLGVQHRMLLAQEAKHGQRYRILI